MKKYDNSDISSLKGADRVRKRPAAVLGSNGLEGARHCVMEIIGNSLDEAQSGFGNKLEVTYHKDKSISIRDYGRGVPMGWNEKEQNWNYMLVYAELYAGGKYNTNQDKLKEVTDWVNFDYKSIPYLFSIGLNGLGAAAVQYSSAWMTVESHKQGICSRMVFKEGVPVLDKLEEVKTDQKDGTFVHWLPDGTVFTNTDIGAKWLKGVCEKISYSAEIEVIFKNESTEERTVFPASNIVKLLAEDVENKPKYKEHIHSEISDKGEVLVCLSKVACGGAGGSNIFFHNNIGINGGAHSDAVTTALVDFIRDIGLGSALKFQDYSNKFSFVVSSYSNLVSYRNQTKDSLDNEYVFRGIRDNIASILSEAWNKKEKWIQIAIKDAQNEAEIRKQTEEYQKQVKEAVKATKNKAKPDKFVSCKSYEKGKTFETELWLLEGDSASGSFKMARDSEYQCFLPLRGKGLNLYKASVDKIFANKEVLSIMSILGCGVDMYVEGEQLFNMSNLKVGKIIIASDADADGLHIRMLIFTMIYKLFPKLLYEGKVFVANTPKHQVLLKDGSIVYCYDDDEFNKLRKEDKVAESMRFKGLGQVNSDILRETTVAPDTRNLQSLQIDPMDNKISDTLEILFGNVTDRRKASVLKKMLGGEYTTFEEALEKLNQDFSELVFDDSGYTIEEVEF